MGEKIKLINYIKKGSLASVGTASFELLRLKSVPLQEGPPGLSGCGQ